MGVESLNHQHRNIEQPLDRMKPGERAVLCRMQKGHSLLERLVDLGWTSGTPIRCVRISPLGDPIAYGIRGGVIALRKKDAHGILVRLEE